MAISIPTAEDLKKAHRNELKAITDSGRLDDVLALLRKAIETNRKSVSLPRKLTSEEYKAVQYKLWCSGWYCQYTFLAWLTGRLDQVKISVVNY